MPYHSTAFPYPSCLPGLLYDTETHESVQNNIPMQHCGVLPPTDILPLQLTTFITQIQVA
jgi:hypothetical protein